MRSNLAAVALPPVGALIQESRHAADFSMPAHRHDCLSILAAVAGAGTCRAGDKALRIAANDLLLIPAGVDHQVEDDPANPLALFVMYLDKALGEEARRILSAAGALRFVRLPDEAAAEVRRLLRRLLYEQSHALPGRDPLIHALLMELFVQCARAQRTTPRKNAAQSPRARVAEVANRIRERYYEPWSVPEAARLAHLSVRRFSALFRQATGRSFVQFLNGVRVEQATRLLRQGDQKVSSVCFEVGFEDLSHFYRVFRQFTGHAPGVERPARRAKAATQQER